MSEQPNRSLPRLWGLALAGGESRRMGQDKGTLSYSGKPQAYLTWQMLDALCPRTFLSVRAEQADVLPYAELPLILDDETKCGPAAGLLAAWTQHADVAWLVLATDMPLVEEALLLELIESRDPVRLATAFRHPDGTPEPLCTIWEPQARPKLLNQARAGEYSLRKLLEQSLVKMLEPKDPGRLVSVNSLADYQAMRQRMGSSSG